MTDSAYEAWQARNATYLGTAIGSLRARLERQVQQTQPAPATEAAAAAAAVNVTPPSPPRAGARWGLFRRGGAREPNAIIATPPQLPAPARVVGVDTADSDAAQAEELSASDPPPALVMLAQRFGLSAFERDLLLLCVGMELETRMPGLFAQAHGDFARPWPTFALAMALLDDPAWEALSPERPLRYWRLLEINQPPGQPLTLSALRADERIVSYVKGLNYLDDRFAPLVSTVEAMQADEAPPSHRAIVERIVHVVGHVAGLPTASAALTAVVRMSGRDDASKRSVASAASSALGRTIYRLPAELLPAHPGELETLARLWDRETRLMPLALYIDAGNAPEGAATSVARFVARTGGLLFVDAKDGATGPGPTLLSVHVEKPTPAEQHDAWQAALGERAGDLPNRLAGQFNLSVADIRAIAAEATQDVSEESNAPQLWASALQRTRPGLGAVAENLTPKADWDSLVLPKPELALLRQIAAQVASRTRVYDDWGFRARMNRGLGIAALFAGDSGVGKTMAAEVIANDLHLELCRIDLSGVVSKYIGETEKNLRVVFDAAEDGGAILFFDEADALFGKRSEVKDAHDRYANIEINYLLQRMEVYRGLCILATNMKSALDPAFMRRLRFIVNFPFPGPAERLEIWRKVFPDAVPKKGLDYERLAQLNLTGGTIHNIALHAAFLAAAARQDVTMPLILDATRTELQKLDRSVSAAELRWVKPADEAA